jgi:two-component system, chemotaxis family, chemotaxis protein CheY
MDDGTGKARLKLPATLDLAAAEGFLDLMRSRLQTEPCLRLDASAVDVLTVPCIQIILAAHQSYGEMAIERPSAAFVSAFEDLGLDWAPLCAAGDSPDGAEAFGSSRIGQAANGIATNIQDLVETAVGEPGGALETNAQDLDMKSFGDADSPTIQAEEAPMAKRILTIDDSKTIRDMLMLTLADAGFDVLQAVDGQDALEVLDKEQVDVVITDINMPRMDGYEVIRQMRSNSMHKSTPILVLTTESELEKKNLARTAGATGWMVKPFDPERLIATINKVAP